MNKQYVISRMTKEEISIAIDWAKREGWNPGLHDAECFYQADAQGFFAGKLDGKLIAMGAAVVYDDHFAFCGLYIVDANYREHGYGLDLTKARLAYVGSRNAGIDGVMEMVPKYKLLGYKTAYKNARYHGINLVMDVPNNPGIVPLSEVPFSQLSAYDRLHFPAAREAFLRCWIKPAGGKSLAYMVHDQLVGYGVIRPCYEGFKIGPLFADTPKIANELFMNLANHAHGKSVYLDIPECNKEAEALVNRHQLKKILETARMYLKAPPAIRLNSIYGVTTFELG